MADPISIVFTGGGYGAYANAAPRRVVLDSLEVDATLSEVVSATNELTQHPIESGSTVSDHVITRPREYRMEGVISGAPISYRDRLDTAVAAVTSLFNPGSGGVGNKAEGALSLLEEMLAKRSTVAIRTPLRLYTDMVMVGLQHNRDPKTGDALHFSAVFQQVRTVKSATVAPKSIPRAESTKQSGRLPTTAAPKSVESDTTLLGELTGHAELRTP